MTLVLDSAAAREVVAATRDRYIAEAREHDREAAVWHRTADHLDRQYRDGLGDGYRRNAADLYAQAADERGRAARMQAYLDRDTPAHIGAVTA